VEYWVIPPRHRRFPGFWRAIDQLGGGVQDVFRGNGEQTGLGCVVAGVVAAALRIAQHAVARAIRAIAAGIGGAIDADDGTAERAGQVQGSGVAGDAEGDAAGEGEELFEGSGERNGRAGGTLHNCIGKRLFAGTGIDEDAVSALAEAAGHGGIALDGPALGAPAGSGNDERDGPGSGGSEQLIAPGFGGGIDGQQRREGASSSPAIC
jgi:hypothetical protein